jgi:4-alpha-glucanotransferase
MAVLWAWLRHIAASKAAVLLVNLEDLWLEAAPQNVPGTWEERPNWKRKARFTIEELGGNDYLATLLDELRRQRR